jgi:hypothetical protein
MKQAHTDMHGLQYAWEYLKRFGRESHEKWLKDFMYAILPALTLAFLARGDRNALEGTLLAVESVVIVFSVVALRHFFSTSLVLFRERTHPESGGIRPTPAKYGFWGATILLALIAAIVYGTLSASLGKVPPLVVKIAAPSAPSLASPEPMKHPDNPPASIEAPKSARPGASQTPTPSAVQTPASSPSDPPAIVQTAPSPAPAPTFLSTDPDPATYLGRVVRENRGLTPSDRDRLSNELSACNDFIKQSQAAGYKVSNELAAISRERQSADLVKTVDNHIKTLHDLSLAAHDQQYAGLQRFQAKWTYFPDQTEYVLGDNPFNAGEGLLLNAIDGMVTELGRFSKAHNLDQQEMRDLEGDQQNVYEKQLRQFFEWASVTLARINQMRQSLDPNGTVQPLPTGAVAPAAAFFSLS